MANALQVNDLTVRLGGSNVLRNLTFSIARGTSLAIIGPNGAGKTVLLKALIGALSHTGTVRWDADTTVGYVPQKLDIERGLPINGRDFLRAKAALAKVSNQEIPQVLHLVGLDEEVLRCPIGGMSGGQFQRLLVALALLGRPNVLLLDEPAAGIDAPGQAQLYDVLHERQLARRLTLVIVSHDLHVVYRYVNNVLCLGRRQVCFGPPRTVLTPDVLYEIYGAPVRFHVHDDT